MSNECDRRFDEALLSGFVDGMITQGDIQRVRLHLERCPECNLLVEELSTLRSTALGTKFRLPEDRQWDEGPRTLSSLWTRNAGWLLFIIWFFGTGSYGLYQLANATTHWVDRLIVFGGLSAFALLLISVLMDRLRDLKTDRYRGVHR